jgi:hypothetical protein
MQLIVIMPLGEYTYLIYPKVLLHHSIVNMSSGMVDVHKEWDRIMLKNALGTSQEKLIGPSTLMPGSNDLCCDLLENICKQSRPIDSKRICMETDVFPDIPVFSAQHENKLLCEPHAINIPNGMKVHMRACVSGHNCVGKDMNIGDAEKNGGRILREMLSPEELVKFETNGSLPSEPRMCVLCARRCATVAYFWCLHERPEIMLRHTVINAYVNPIDCAGGYRSEFAIPNVKDGSWRCMVGPVVTNSLSKMRYRQNKEGVWYVDQQALIWDKAKAEDEDVSLF